MADPADAPLGANPAASPQRGELSRCVLCHGSRTADDNIDMEYKGEILCTVCWLGMEAIPTPAWVRRLQEVRARTNFAQFLIWADQQPASYWCGG